MAPFFLSTCPLSAQLTERVFERNTNLSAGTQRPKSRLDCPSASCCTCAHISRVGSPATWSVPVDDEQTTSRRPAVFAFLTASAVRLPSRRWPEPSIDSALSKDAVAGGGVLGAARQSVSLASTPAIRQFLEGTEGWGPVCGGHQHPLQPWTRHGEQMCGGLGAAGGLMPLTPHSKSGLGPQGLPEPNTYTALATNTCNFSCDGLFRLRLCACVNDGVRAVEQSWRHMHPSSRTGRPRGGV